MKNRMVTLTVMVVFAVLMGIQFADAASRCATCARDARGRIARDSRAIREFKSAIPRPPGCRRCEVDHIVPLHKGGTDTPGNMQWLPRDVHRDKTKSER